MKVVRVGDSPEQPNTAPIMIGDVAMRPLLGPDTGAKVTVALVRFRNGGRNKRHTHSEDQILYITEGHGIVADADHEHLVEGGDIVHVPAGTTHWHGAQPGRDMAHLNIMPPGAKTDVVE
ncbi:MAG: cupin domain-containing protein [Dehalococcoidia bacterium]